MQAVVIAGGRFGLAQRADPVPGRGEVLVEVRAAGLNAADLQQARGDYPAPSGWPAEIPGLEVAGEVLAVGDSVGAVSVGDAVMGLIGGGGHAQRVVIPADLLMGVPAGVSWEQAGGFPETFSTAWDALVTQAQVGVGDRVLVTGAAGGVGTAMVQVAAVTGARVVASVRCRELHMKVQSLVPERDRLTVVTPDEEAEYGPFDVIVELVGGADCLNRVSLMATGGRLLLVGVQAGLTASLPMFALMLARATVIGTTIRGRSHAEKVLLARTIADKVAPLLTDQRIQVPIEAAYRLDQYDQGYERLAAAGKFGKIVFTP